MPVLSIAHPAPPQFFAFANADPAHITREGTEGDCAHRELTPQESKQLLHGIHRLPRCCETLDIEVSGDQTWPVSGATIDSFKFIFVLASGSWGPMAANRE